MILEIVSSSHQTSSGGMEALAEGSWSPFLSAHRPSQPGISL